MESSPRTSGDQRDNKIAELAWYKLSQSPYQELKHVSCASRNGVLVLEGEVSSFYLKQLAQEIVRNVDKVESIANQLNVRGTAN